MQPAWEYVCLKGSWGTMDIISLGYNFSWIIILVSCGIVQYEGGQAVITHNVCNIILAEYFHRVGTYKMTTFVKRVVEFSKVSRQFYHPECFDSYPQIYQSTSSVRRPAHQYVTLETWLALNHIYGSHLYFWRAKQLSNSLTTLPKVSKQPRFRKITKLKVQKIIKTNIKNKSMCDIRIHQDCYNVNGRI